MEILIAGAGIGGLTAGLCLQQAGHCVTLVERSDKPSEVGAGIQCGANAVHVLESLGLLPALLKLAVEPKKIVFRDYRSGASLYDMPLGEAYRDRYGAPYLHLHRADLQTLLLKAFGASGGRVHFAAPLRRFSETRDQVSVYLDGDRAISVDCLIGADGIRSQVKGLLFGDKKPKFTGNVAWRGLVPTAKLPPDFLPTVASNFIGPNKHMVIYYLRGGEFVNFVGVVENKDWTNDSWTAKAPWQELQADFLGWHPTVETLIDAVDKESCFRWALFDHPVLTHWSSERVTLLGDAAHATLPFMASGAALAIEDARILQRSFAQTGDVASALRLYQANRIERTARVQKASARLGKIYHLQSHLARKLAFAGIKTLGSKEESFLPDYNANSVPLV